MRLLAVALSLVALVVVGCSKPDPPVLTPQSAKVTGVTFAGVSLELRLEAFNPNSSELSARSVTGKVVLDGRVDLGTAKVASAIRLPAGARTTLDVPLALTWTDVSALAVLASSNRAIPYTIDGTVTVGGERLNVDLPFHMDGSITHEEMVQATSRSLPPGVKLPF